jgi:hypothetical protein
MWRTILCVASTLFLIVVPEAQAHPGAVADGRASCVTEYTTPATAYEIPDVTEAWYVRRVATCQSPVFWTKFDITEPNQDLYIAVISPEIDRFRDNLQFHALLYGPGVSDDLPGFTSVPSTLPGGVIVESNLGSVAYATSPDNLGSCDFVDTNAVMRFFSDLVEGRCMEEFFTGSTSEDPLQRETTSMSWWLYSYNHQASTEVGTYYLQTWLTTRQDTDATAPGKYEITLGPWSWSGYASEATLELAQSQGTSCSCALNALDYKEHYLERLGGVESDLYTAQLPAGTCSDETNNVSPCVTVPQLPYITDDSAVEWSGIFSLKAGRTYSWTFRAYYQGANAAFEYPDPGMWVYATSTTSSSISTKSMDSFQGQAMQANQDLTTAVEVGILSPTVSSGEMLDLTLNNNEAQYVVFANTTVQNFTTILLMPELDINLALFTQHVPFEFMAHFLVDETSGDYVFPMDMALYTADAVEPPPSSSPPSSRNASSFPWLGSSLFMISTFFLLYVW